MRLIKRAGVIGAGLMLLLAAVQPAFAEYALNMPRGVTETSQQVYGLHMTILWICVAIGVVVYGVMFYSILKHRKSRGAKAAQFHHSTTLEIVWTVIPLVILVVMAVPATQVLIDMEDTADAEMSVKVTGYQWKWGYEYMGEGVQFYSDLDQASQAARQLNPSKRPEDVENYLLDVNKPLVLPTNTKVRLLITSDDVIHAWWVPDLGWKKDAIPGYVNATWTEIKEPGTYRGQCAELCGRDHGYMPIVVVAKEPEEFQKWLAEQKQQQGVQSASMDSGDGGSVQPASAATDDSAAGGGAQAESGTDGAGDAGSDQMAKAASGGELAQAELMQLGEQVYNQRCASCHQASGEGVPPTFPALKGSPVATGPVDQHLDVIIDGVSGTAMQAFGTQLSDRQLAAVATYTRNAFGNDTGDVVQPADVQAAR